MGYPISPAFATNVRVGGVDNTFVYVQAFERRVLTYTPNNPAPFKVESGNIGQHYYRWRYTQDAGGTVVPASTATLAPTATTVSTIAAPPTTRGNPPTLAAPASSTPSSLPPPRP